MGYKQIAQLQDADGDIVAEVELPATAPTPRIIVLDGVAFERHIDLLIYRAVSYFWIDNEVNQQRLINETGEQVWNQPIHRRKKRKKRRIKS